MHTPSLYLSTGAIIYRSNAQEEYIALHGYRESGLLGTDTNIAMEWACKLKSECSLDDGHRLKLVGLFRYVPRYRGQDISLLLLIGKKTAENSRTRIRQEGFSAQMQFLCTANSQVENLNQGGTTKANFHASRP